MAEVTYTNEQTKTANRARLITFAISRELDPGGQPTGNVSVRGVAQIGFWDGATFTELERVPFIETRSLAQVAAFFGAPTLSTMESKTLERMQALGKLPAGSIA
jgi:hypothetical protein